MKLVTLIIPTYNRPDFLKRILNYYNQSNIVAEIIVADSSNPTNKILNKKIVQSFPKLNILYLNKFSPVLVSHHKFAKMVEFVKTKYCVFCADDDFIMPNGIKQSVNFLEKNPDYSAAHGTYISFYIYKSLTGIKEFWWKYIYPYKSITSSDASERTKLHPTDCFQVIWAVRRTHTVKTCYKELLRSKVNPYLFGELLPDILTVILGKTKRLDVFYAARQAFSTSYSYWPSLPDAIKNGTFDKEYAKFKNCLIANLVKKSHIEKVQAAQIIDTNIKMYIKSTFQEQMVVKINQLLKPFPKFISNSIRTLHAKYLFSKEKTDGIGVVAKPHSPYFTDFNLIKKTVLENS